MLQPKPDLLVVQGDTSSALGASLGAFRDNVAVAHVEAGLRTHDPLQPWPEEEYRVAIDAGAQLLFAPTELSAHNLRMESVAGEIHVTGNTSIDAVLAAEAKLPPSEPNQSSKRPLLVTCHRRESWGEGLREIASAMIELGSLGRGPIHVVLHPNPHVAEAMRERLSGAKGVSLLEPCGHLEMIRRMREAKLILSDSGGMQEEAPALGVPLLVLREKTERPEGLASGNMRLIGKSAGAIVRETIAVADNAEAHAEMSRRAYPYGDGQAATRIAAIIDHWLAVPFAETMDEPTRPATLRRRW
jgi:UDP-N-acetylglucosamine 2-epimerase (non-hydrolysing)